MDYPDRTGAGQTVLFSNNDNLNFDHILNDACTRLWNKKAELSIRKIRALENTLLKMEQELTDFLSSDRRSEDQRSEDRSESITSAELIAGKGNDA
ncbi:hypothetical protein AGMMS50267_01790 [Spirochaetia bacterium]|nr:hypothetical protein AGMMS50267_01790 [Spirochaetia bacterium]